jgi:hypothetical protein
MRGPLQWVNSFRLSAFDVVEVEIAHGYECVSSAPIDPTFERGLYYKHVRSQPG